MVNQIEQLNQKIKELEEENIKLKEVNERMLAINNCVKDGIAILDKAGKVINVNKRIVEISGYSEKELLGNRVAMLKMVTPESMVKMAAAVVKDLKGEESGSHEVEVKTKSGGVKFVEIQSYPLKIGGKIRGVVAILRDITSRKKAEEEVEGRTKELERFNNLAIGRELQMVELKNKIKELKEKLK